MTLSIKMCNFAEDRMRLNKENKFSLSSACAIFAEDRLRLNKANKLSLSSACAIFALYTIILK